MAYLHDARRDLVDRGSVVDAMSAAQVCHSYVDLRAPRMELRDVAFRARAGQSGQGLRVESIQENVTRLGFRRSAREPPYARDFPVHRDVQRRVTRV